jgi:hypothetical protein
MTRMRNARAAFAALVLLGAAPSPSPIEHTERDFAELRALQDLLDVAEARGAAITVDGGHVSETARLRNQLRAAVGADLAGLALPKDAANRAALVRMREALEEMTGQTAAETQPSATATLRADTYKRYGEAARAVRVGDEVIDRLTVLTRLGQEPDAARRRELFLSLRPVWETMNADNTPDSPYRQLARAEAEKWRPGASPVEASAQALGIPPADLEWWLVRVLERWRDTVAVPGEPWDHWYAAGEVSRLFAARLPLVRMLEVNDHFYRDLGAEPTALGVSYDLDPREGKTPVAFTTFGSRPVLERGRWKGARAWVFATYRVGGFDNLGELLHETGHAVHISAIRTRPAFADWPDSDPFTEALGDLMALEAYEPAWQRRYLGAEAPRAANLRAKYASVMLDVCWALFEWRMHREPGQDPNAVWTELTREYLKIAPHPELSWWAARGQLVDAPGYMMNYAIGAALAADLRGRTRVLHASFSEPRRDTYAFLSERLYRFGRSRPSREVIEAFLGRGATTEALLRELQR